MILNSTPTHVYHIPDHILDYLKGFLEAKGINAKTVYWNIVLSREFQQLNKEVIRNPELLDVIPFDDITLAIWKWLMKDYKKINELPENPILSIVYTKKELSQVAHSIKDKIDWYIRENSLHKELIAGFIMKPREWVMNAYLISRLKDMNPDIKTVVITAADEEQGHVFMDVFPQIDFALWGDVEFPLHYLIEALEEGTTINSVPHLVYRDGNTICFTKSNSEPHPDLDSYPFADHTDYFDALEKFIPGTTRVIVPLWGSRSCSWNKCKFCILNKNLLYRARSPENIGEEIEYQAEKHSVKSFIFQDSDFAGDKKRFQTLLKLLSQLSANREEPYHFFGSTSSFFITAETARDISLAPFDFIYVGFEAVTDTLLEKLQKRNRVAHNIQALKFGRQHELGMHLNVLRGIPSETEEDILESCKNVKFLRFFLDSYKLNSLPIMLFKKSTFYEEMSEEERKTWNYDRSWLGIAPSGLIPESERFEFFGFYRKESQHRLWDDFDMIVDFYAKHAHSYTWIETENGSVIEEKGLRVYRYTLDRDETDLLVFCDTIRTLDEVKERLSHVEENSLYEMMSTLKEVALLYYDKNMRTIISTVEACRKGTQDLQKAAEPQL